MKRYHEMSFRINREIQIKSTCLFCTLTGKGLGFYSEQVIEIVHHDHLATEQNFQCSEENPDFGE